MDDTMKKNKILKEGEKVALSLSAAREILDEASAAAMGGAGVREFVNTSTHSDVAVAKMGTFGGASDEQKRKNATGFIGQHPVTMTSRHPETNKLIMTTHPSVPHAKENRGPHFVGSQCKITTESGQESHKFGE